MVARHGELDVGQVMRILFALGRPYVPERLSGAELSAHTLLQTLVARGQRCEVVAVAAPGWRLSARRLRSVVSRRPLAYLDRRNGYVTHRAFEGRVARLAAERIARFRPDLVVAALDESAAIAAEAVRTETPVLISILDNAYRWLDRPLPESPLVGLICNSRFIAGRARERFGAEPAVIYPSVRLADYRADRLEPGLVTFVNPVYEKGLDKALRLAELLPQRRFQFVRGWFLPRALAEENERRVRAAPNVTYRERTRDMRSVYAQTSVLVAPSVWEEAFGRVILEAHASSIPVIATRIGGIPEALGGGGLLLLPEASPEEWAGAVESVLSDGALRSRLSAQARANAARPELDPECIADRFLEAAAAHLGRRA
jgi:glycosyltransferase involved in cell wall biosynthesis